MIERRIRGWEGDHKYYSLFMAGMIPGADGAAGGTDVKKRGRRVARKRNVSL